MNGCYITYLEIIWRCMWYSKTSQIVPLPHSTELLSHGENQMWRRQSKFWHPPVHRGGILTHSDQNTFSIFNKYIFRFRSYNLDKCIVQFRQIHFQKFSTRRCTAAASWHMATKIWSGTCLKDPSSKKLRPALNAFEVVFGPNLFLALWDSDFDHKRSLGFGLVQILGLLKLWFVSATSL